MRFALPCVIVVVCVVVELLNPARIQPPPQAQPMEETPVAAVMDGPNLSNICVPQDEGNLRELDICRQCNDPCLRDLANGRFTGGKFADLLAAYPPDLVLKHGDYETAIYAEVRGNLPGSYGSTCVVALKGRMVYSFGASCVRHPIFFNGLSETQRDEWSEGYQAAYRKHFNLPPLPPKQQAAPAAAN